MAEATAMAKTGWKPLEFFSGGGAAELGVPVAVLAIVMALITPLPPFLLDLLLVVDIMMSVIVMMVAMYITRPSDFNVFPTTLLLLTLYRLALNVSSARLILLNGNTGTSAAGHVIEAFGSFVVGGNYIIGTVIFLVLIAIQYVVINHGAVRISEVTARFTLDALPGKQMSIDSDLSSGLIDETEARRRRKQLAAEAEFYGAMDGASRFTQRDAVASILITSINIIAGFLIGVLQHGMELRHALETYTVLTIGDGLVTVVPALMISVSGALVITRSGSDARLGADFSKQIFGSPQPLLLASGVLIILACVPGMPGIPFLLLGVGLGAGGWRMHSRPAAKAQAPGAAKPARENLESLLKVEPLAIEVGLGLVKMVEGAQNSPLLKRISGIRRQLAGDLGYLLPPVRVADNLALRAREYWRPGGFPTSAPSRPARPDTRWSMRSACWARTLRSWPGSTPMSCSRGRMPRRCWTWRPSISPKWSRIWCPNSSRCRWSSAYCRVCCGSASPSAIPARFWRRWARRPCPRAIWCCSSSTPGRPSAARSPSATWTQPATCRLTFWTLRSSKPWSPRCSMASRTVT